ncbi:MAG: hypothetical protein ABI333_21440 [bacterium]
MIRVPVPEPASPREGVIEILAHGLCELVMRGCKPDQPRGERHPVFGGQARHRNPVGNRRPAQRADR